jgi:hypothetical protein
MKLVVLYDGAAAAVKAQTIAEAAGAPSVSLLRDFQAAEASLDQVSGPPRCSSSREC